MSVPLQVILNGDSSERRSQSAELRAQSSELRAQNAELRTVVILNS